MTKCALPENPPTPRAAKKIIARVLKEHGLDNRLTGQTKWMEGIRKNVCFVYVWDWSPSPIWQALELASYEGGFMVRCGSRR